MGIAIIKGEVPAKAAGIDQHCSLTNDADDAVDQCHIPLAVLLVQRFHQRHTRQNRDQRNFRQETGQVLIARDMFCIASTDAHALIRTQVS